MWLKPPAPRRTAISAIIERIPRRMVERLKRYRAALILTVLFGLFALAWAQNATDPTPLNQRIIRQARAALDASPEAEIKLGPRAPSKDFPGYDALTVTVVDDAGSHPYDFLLSKDSARLIQITQYDLSADPYAKLYSKMKLAGRPIAGNKDAKVTIVVYDDYECPYCARLYDSLFHKTLPDYKDKVRVIYKDFPLDFHPWAMRAALDANCLAEQSPDAYWEFSDFVHSNHALIDAQAEMVEKASRPKNGDKSPWADQEPEVDKYVFLDKVATDVAGKSKLDAGKLNACFAAKKTDAVNASLAEGRDLNIDGTPTLFINGEREEGAMSPAELKRVLDRALRDAGEQPPASKPAPAPAKSGE
jgi:protein-disulfide isomerase